MTEPSATLEKVTSLGQRATTLHDCRTLYLKLITQLLQEGDHLPAEAINAFERECALFFDAMTSPKRKSSFEDAGELTASCISLVAENDLEIDIRLGEFTARLLEKNGGELWRVFLRFVTLLERPDMSTADNPVGPKGIAEGLTALSKALVENHDKTLDRLERLENHFADHLSVLYASLNDFFDNRQVEAAQPGLISAPNTNRAGGSEKTLNPALALQKNLLGPQDQTGSQAGESNNTSGGMGGSGNSAAAVLFNQAILERLLSRLDELELNRPYPGHNSSIQSLDNAPLETLIPGLFAATEPPSVEKPRSLKSNELGIPGGAPEAATIDALALIFEAIFASEQLPDVIKAILSSLQIPLLKAAMLDATFFTAERHPAREVLDKMAIAALGLSCEVAADHPLCVSLKSIAGRLRSEFSRDMQVFEKYAGALDSLIAGRKQSVKQTAEAYRALLDEFEQRQQAALRSRKAIEQFLAQGIPEAIAGFLNNHWFLLLENNWLEGGEQSEAWQQNIEVIHLLLWSIQPKTEIDERKQLAKHLPDMLKRLNTGMACIGMSEELRTEFLDTCFALQTAAMRGLVAPVQNAPVGGFSAVEHFACIETGPLLLKTCQLAETASGPPPFRPEQWITFDYAGEKHCGCFFSDTGFESSVLLVNPEWSFAIALPMPTLNRQIKNGRTGVVPTDSLFNTAAEKALHNTPKKDVLT